VLRVRANATEYYFEMTGDKDFLTI